MKRQRAGLRIGITLGDVNGIGPEVSARAITALRSQAEWMLIGPRSALPALTGCSVKKDIVAVDTLPECAVAGRILLWAPPGMPESRLRPGRPRVDAARTAYAALLAGADAAGIGALDALVTAPISKEAFALAGLPSQGHTEILARHFKRRSVAMLLVGDGLRVALATRHVSLAHVPRRITRPLLLEQLTLLREALPWLGCRTGRIGVAGLNPHAGDGGALGVEEIRVIAPAVRSVRRRGWNVEGPVAGDTIFHQALSGRFAVVLAMYHDQGLAALKTVAFDSGVNITLGLPIVRTSPDHGTAYDLAGKGKARPQSMIEAVRMAMDLARRPNPWARA